MNPAPPGMTPLSPGCRYSLVLVLLLLAGRGRSQESIRLRALEVGQEPAFRLYFIGEESVEEVRVSPVQPSRPVKIPYANPLPVYGERPDPADAESILPVELIPLPESEKNILLLCMGTGQCLAIKDDLPEADFRDWRLINMTSSPIAFEIGEDSDPVILQANSQSHYRLPFIEPGGRVVRAAAWIDGETRLFYSTYWPLRENSRGIIVFVKEGTSILVRRVMDTLPDKVAKKEK